jgi:metal-sulfur cluster biosynthetic enzyme
VIDEKVTQLSMVVAETYTGYFRTCRIREFGCMANERNTAIEQEIFDIIKSIRDPERTESLEELNVISEDMVYVTESNSQTLIRIEFVPTVAHCSLATLIGQSTSI